ncbi:AraC family transcriptional regulator [Roseibium sp. SCP14]|uniref:AraC family transcriptional regulator n=1 Tax=Roseibium sp. SCP14 TaxID=3141375 RepID=UPI003335F675
MTDVNPPRKLRNGQIVRVDSAIWPRTTIDTVLTSFVREKFQTFVFLEGEQSFWLDEKFFHVDAGHGSNRRPKALTFALKRNTEIRLLRGTSSPLNKVSITSPIGWMDEMEISGTSRSASIVDFMSGHLNHLVWEPGPEVVALAEQVSAPPRWLGNDMLPLYRTARGFDLMISVCRKLSGEGENQVPVHSRTSASQMERVRDFIMDNLHEDFHIEDIARQTGTSVRSLQRKFKDFYGETVFEFVRNARLERAREALLRDHISVSDASLVAGYASPAAFATAFRKRFGEVPRRMRAALRES